MAEQPWWQRPLRVLQTNLQVKDTPLMDPAQIAHDTEALGCNVLVTNVGGIYAWYPSRVPFHHINEYLPADFDLLGRLVEECHKRGIRVVARFDFSKTDDVVFQQRPQWFVRDAERKPVVYGRDRMGPWSLLLSTCLNGGYRNEAVAQPVLREAMSDYPLDGVFLNAPHYEHCLCDGCRARYREAYGRELPADRAALAPDWGSRCIRSNVEGLYRTLKDCRPDVPMLLYFNTHDPNENLRDRYATADVLCVEAQDVLSLGWQDLPAAHKPALHVKLGRRLPGHPKPMGIIHSCPGMDWRHTGLPAAEYRWWMSQVPANGGTLWHSVTGFERTMEDKRLLRTIGEVNQDVARAEEAMEGAREVPQVALLWHGQASAEGWAEALTTGQLPWAVLDRHQLNRTALAPYPVVVLPDGFPLDEPGATALAAYVAGGGRLLAESTDPATMALLAPLTGWQGPFTRSEPLTASYLRLERRNAALERKFEDVGLLALRGTVMYGAQSGDTEALATLVPPFAPPDGVGAPPERASLPTPRTDLPLITLRGHGQGQVLTLAMEAGRLIGQYRLADHLQLLTNAMGLLLGDRRVLWAPLLPGLSSSLWRRGNHTLLHLVNGVGQRPLAAVTPLQNLSVTLRLAPGQTVRAVRARIGGGGVDWWQDGTLLHATLERLEVWEMLEVTCTTKKTQENSHG